MAAEVTITIVGRSYEIVCDDGQQDAIRSLAETVDRRALEVLRAVGQVGDARLLVMVALSMADELNESQGSLAHVQTVASTIDGVFAEGIESLTRRIEAIAERLEHT